MSALENKKVRAAQAAVYAVYRAKGKGRNRVLVFLCEHTPPMVNGMAKRILQLLAPLCLVIALFLERLVLVHPGALVGVLMSVRSLSYYMTVHLLPPAGSPGFWDLSTSATMSSKAFCTFSL